MFRLLEILTDLLPYKQSKQILSLTCNPQLLGYNMFFLKTTSVLGLYFVTNNAPFLEFNLFLENKTREELDVHDQCYRSPLFDHTAAQPKKISNLNKYKL